MWRGEKTQTREKGSLEPKVKDLVMKAGEVQKNRMEAKSAEKKQTKGEEWGKNIIHQELGRTELREIKKKKGGHLGGKDIKAEKENFY